MCDVERAKVPSDLPRHIWEDAAMEPSTVRFEGFEGIHLAADVRGNEDAWPVLLMHGGGQTRHAWGNTAESLAEQGWKTVSLDLRGHGDSEWALNLSLIHI